MNKIEKAKTYFNEILIAYTDRFKNIEDMFKKPDDIGRFPIGTPLITVNRHITDYYVHHDLSFQRERFNFRKNIFPKIVNFLAIYELLSIKEKEIIAFDENEYSENLKKLLLEEISPINEFIEKELKETISIKSEFWKENIKFFVKTKSPNKLYENEKGQKKYKEGEEHINSLIEILKGYKITVENIQIEINSTFNKD